LFDLLNEQAEIILLVILSFFFLEFSWFTVFLGFDLVAR